MADLFSLLKKYNCIDIKICTVGNIMISPTGEYDDLDEAAEPVQLSSFVFVDDLPPLMNELNEFSMSPDKRMTAHFRIENDGELHWAYMCCKKSGAEYLEGVLIDVYEYMDNMPKDNVINSYEERQENKISISGANTATLLELCGKDYLLKLQKPFESEPGLYSAISDEKGRVICTPGGNIDMSLFKYVVRKPVRFAFRTGAYWYLCSDNERAVSRAEPYLSGMADCLSSIAHSIIALYNETENSNAVNRQLGENVEQQMLINSMQSSIMEEPSAHDALTKVLEMAGEYLRLDGIIAYGANGNGKGRELCRWGKPGSTVSNAYGYMQERFGHIISDMGDSENYFSVEGETKFAGLGLSAFAVSKIIGNDNNPGLIIYTVQKETRLWSYGERKMIRNISQVISSILFRCETEKKIEEKNSQLYNLAFFDSVLGIKNRAKLDIDLSAELEAGGSGAALAIQILNTRFLNEVFGQRYTDKLLREVAKFMSSPDIGSNGVYRYSGSIMMIIAKGYDADKAQDITHKILDRMREPFDIDGVEQYAEAAIGIAVYSDGIGVSEDLYRAATLSLYRANEYGKNTFAFYNREFMDAKGTAYHLESELRRCIADNMRNFEVTYQPAFDPSGAIDHYEALLRWKSEEMGSISPKLFMKLMEKVGLDTSIDLWVLPHACRFCRSMKDTLGRNVRVSVNLTTHEMQTGALPARFRSALTENGLDGSCIIAEVPEAAHVLSYTDTASTLGKLKKLGVNICIDSFGNEYLPLHVLKNSYIDMIKVSSSFVTNSGGDFDDVLLSTTFSLAKSKGITICVKNIEYRTQYDAAKNAGADLVQGGFLRFPATAEEILASLRRPAAQPFMRHLASG